MQKKNCSQQKQLIWCISQASTIFMRIALFLMRFIVRYDVRFSLKCRMNKRKNSLKPRACLCDYYDLFANYLQFMLYLQIICNFCFMSDSSALYIWHENQYPGNPWIYLSTTSWIVCGIYLDLSMRYLNVIMKIQIYP